RASLQQMWMAGAPVNFVITAEYSRIRSKYGERGIRYAMVEAGHVGQNLFLQAEALGLKAGIVGAFEDMKVINVLGIPREHEPLLIMPIG
ncbi:MAG: nitroreductase family protein, partial [Deltaproteobacteria bacterium]|nr:nitroreductase family protein [Deltaproteobacteria bacterium]